MMVNCVRCAGTFRLHEVDIVGTGYRCQTCSVAAALAAAHGVADVGDNLDLATRHSLARRARLQMFGGLFGTAGLFAPAVLATLAMGLGGWTVVLTLIAFYAMTITLGTFGDGLEKWRRYAGVPALPTATVRLLRARATTSG
jgi:hypothetical protein